MIGVACRCPGGASQPARNMDAINLRMLIELATSARDAAAVQRARSGAAVEAARQQLNLLKGYAADYERRSQRTLASGADIAAQTNLHAFTGKLQHAIAQQHAEIERRTLVLAQAERELAAAQRKMKSLQALQERTLAAACAQQNQREQRRLDEVAQVMLAGGGRPLAVSGW